MLLYLKSSSGWKLANQFMQKIWFFPWKFLIDFFFRFLLENRNSWKNMKILSKIITLKIDTRNTSIITQWTIQRVERKYRGIWNIFYRSSQNTSLSAFYHYEWLFCLLSKIIKNFLLSCWSSVQCSRWGKFNKLTQNSWDKTETHFWKWLKIKFIFSREFKFNSFWNSFWKWVGIWVLS